MQQEKFSLVICHEIALAHLLITPNFYPPEDHCTLRFRVRKQETLTDKLGTRKRKLNLKECCIMDKGMNFEDSFKGWSVLSDLILYSNKENFKKTVKTIEREEPTTCLITSIAKPKLIRTHTLTAVIFTACYLKFKNYIEQIRGQHERNRRRERSKEKGKKSRFIHRDIDLNKTDHEFANNHFGCIEEMILSNRESIEDIGIQFEERKDSPTRVYNNLIKDINQKVQDFKPRRINIRNIQSSYSRQRQKRIVELSNNRTIKTPTREEYNNHKIQMISRLRNCQSPLDILNVWKTISVPYLAIESPIHKSIFRQKL